MRVGKILPNYRQFNEFILCNFEGNNYSEVDDVIDSVELEIDPEHYI